MTIDFARSPRSTLGIEWELALVDPTSRSLANVAPPILAELERRWPQSPGAPQATSELLQNTVELVSAPHRRVREAIGELRLLAADLLDQAKAHGVRVIGTGSHPFSRWEDQLITPGERYGRFVERTQWWGRNMLIWGVHVHVGIDRRERVIPTLHTLLTYQPVFQALSASSPFWAGEATGYRSNRTLMFQQLPSAGLPAHVESWEDFERVIEDLTRTGVIAEPTEARWDVRPAPRWGTIEVRFCDGSSSLETLGALAALTQCLVEDCARRLDRGETLPLLPPWFARENKWRAARFGLDAEVIYDEAGSQARLRDRVSVLVDRLAPVAADLGCVEELEQVARIAETGTSADRQLETYSRLGGTRDALRAVVDSEADVFERSVRG